MAAQWKKTFNVDLTRDEARPIYGGTILYQGDSNSNVLTVNLYDDGVAYSGGGTVAGTAVRKDNVTVPLTGGSVNGNVVSITLNASCFLAPGGRLEVYVNLTSEGVTTTILNVVYLVVRTTTDDIVDPSGEIALNVATLVAEIEEAKTVFDSMTVATVAETKSYLGWS